MGEPTRDDTRVAGALAVGSALVVAGILIIGHSDVTRVIGLVMLPGVLVVGSQWMRLRRRSRVVRLGLSVGLLVPLFLIGLVAGVATRG